MELYYRTARGKCGIYLITVPNSSRQRVYLFQQKILNEHTVVIGHKELMNLFDDIRTIYEGVFAVEINGHQNKISIFDGDIVNIQGAIEDKVVWKSDFIKLEVMSMDGY